MKYLVPCLIVLPLITSCSAGIYEYAPPPPQVEVHPQPDRYYRPATHVRVYHGHPAPRGNTVIVTPRGPRAQVEVHDGDHRNENEVRHSHHSESRVEVQKGHGHNGTVVTRSHSETNVRVSKKEGHGNSHDNVVGHP